MAPPRLLVALRTRDEAKAVIGAALPDVEWAFSPEGAVTSLDSVEAMLLGSVERDLGNVDLAHLPNLRFVQRVYAGLDGIPFGRFAPSVRFAGNVGAYAPFVAEHAVALALGAARELPRAHIQAVSGKLRPPPEHRLLWQQTAVILGYGEIGRAIAERLAGFRMRILGLNRTGRMVPGVHGMFPADRICDAVREGDFVFDARPLTRATEGSIDASVLAAMRPAAVFINVGRAGTVREEDLYQHLRAHPEFRAALDVWWHEEFADGRIAHRFPFAELPNVVGTPHCAGFGPGVDSYVLQHAVENLVRFFAGEEPRHVVDRSEYERRPS